MPQTNSRRNWLKNSAAVLAGIGIAPNLWAIDYPTKNSGGIILLNSNENPYGPSAATKRAMADALSNSNRYPDDHIPVLKKQLADFWEVGSEHILMGAGSSEILGLTFLMVAGTKGNIISAQPSYSVWNGQAESFGLKINRVPLTNKKTLDLAGMLAAIDEDTKLVYVCNPNNPTGTFVEDAPIRNFVEECSKKCMVLVDEAYTEFAALPSLKDIAIENPNVVVAKTFSKIYGLAGARIGYAIAHADTIKKLSGLQAWPNVSISMVTAAAAAAALKDQAFVKDCRSRTLQAREMCYKTCSELQLEFIPSVTSFVMFNIDKIGSSFSKQLLEKNIMVQYRDHFGGKWCRVSMGTIEEMEVFCKALKSIG